MSKCFLLTWHYTKEPIASAYTPLHSKAGQDLIVLLNGHNKLPFELNLVKLSLIKNELVKSSNIKDLPILWLDYLPNNLAWPLMSSKLKEIIDNNLSGNEGVDWISATINGDNEKRTYYIPRFNHFLDVLDFEKTIFVPGTDHVIKPVFSISKIRPYCIFTKPSGFDLWKITPNLYIKDELKMILKKEKITGLDFSEIKLS